MLEAVVTTNVLPGSSALARAEPSDTPVAGPKLVCFKYSTFQLGEGERVTDLSGSAEAMAITVEGPSGTFRIGESEIFALSGDKSGLSSRRGKRASIAYHQKAAVTRSMALQIFRTERIGS